MEQPRTSLAITHAVQPVGAHEVRCFVAIFPEMADDSYATIGLDGPASTSGLDGAEDPSLVQDVDVALTVEDYFLSGGTELSVNTLIGASWYVLNTATNALPVEGRWLVAQITTSGDVSGQINYQVFPEGDGENDITISLSFDGAGVFGTDAVEGCTDEMACNYDPAALLEDESCEFESCLGCTDLAACNFNENALFEDGSCLFCNCGASSSGYSLVVTADPAASVEGANRFRFYVQMASSGDKMSAVYGNSETPLFVNVPEGAYNSALNTSWSASGINPVFLPSFPELADDCMAQSAWMVRRPRRAWSEPRILLWSVTPISLWSLSSLTMAPMPCLPISSLVLHGLF